MPFTLMSINKTLSQWMCFLGPGAWFYFHRYLKSIKVTYYHFKSPLPRLFIS